ncbi:cyclin-dependent kinase 3-like protein [Perkinsela sp. CCAP 1560/4]|nr:cyclin-dependent kinase 3-like protein [Perkinsela sp. CCAP 1560/4]|eukprot:KNH09517.1 cyclin-dependent kinase 3-like protein [Perkinsela sp. CCAP 1560/4]
MDNVRKKEIRKKIDIGRHRKKGHASTAPATTPTNVDWTLLLGVPAFCLAVLLCEKNVDPMHIGLLIVVNVVYYVLLHEFSMIDRATFILLNIVIITSGDKIKEIWRIREHFTVEEIILTGSADLFVLLALWMTFPKKYDRSTFWDVALAMILGTNVILALYTGKLQCADIFKSLAILRRLMPF